MRTRLAQLALCVAFFAGSLCAFATASQAAWTEDAGVTINETHVASATESRQVVISGACTNSGGFEEVFTEEGSTRERVVKTFARSSGTESSGSVSLQLPAGVKYEVKTTSTGTCTARAATAPLAAASGAEGPPGLTWRGPWAGGTTYALHDAVSYEGSSWISLKAANTGNAPATGSSWWEVIAAVGKEGKEGKGGAGGETTISGFGPTAQATLAEGVETVELMGWCLVGTMLAGLIFLYTRRLLGGN